MIGIVYYTNNLVREDIAITARKLLSSYGIPIVSVSQKPIDFGYNIVVPYKSSILSMFKQQLLGFKEMSHEIIFCCEHDVLYHKSHFDFIPKEKAWYFNTNVWTLNAETGDVLWYNDRNTTGRKMTSGLVAYRELLIEHYSKKIEIAERGEYSIHNHGYRPGKKSIDNYPEECYRSEACNIDIKHDVNITKGRFNLEEFRNKERIKKSWMIVDRVPNWGITKGRVEDFLKDCIKDL